MNPTDAVTELRRRVAFEGLRDALLVFYWEDNDDVKFVQASDPEAVAKAENHLEGDALVLGVIAVTNQQGKARYTPFIEKEHDDHLPAEVALLRRIASALNADQQLDWSKVQ